MQSALDRRQAILEALSDRRQSTLDALAAEFGVSKRTIRYDIDILSCSAPILSVQGGGGGIRVADGWYVSRRYLQDDQEDLLRKLTIDETVKFRKWAKIKSTYIDGYMKHINAATGRIHPDLMPMGTDTGRFAARKPNLQNMPRKGSDPIGVRSFVVAKDGSRFLDFDFSQIELRVGAYYCRDEKMLDTYRNGGDIHAATTSVIFNIPVSEAVDKDNPDYKERRTIAKNVNFGTFYGLFSKGLQRTLRFKAGLDKPIDDCEAIIRNLKAGYPGLTEWQQRTIRDARLCGYSETAFGRRRYLPSINNKQDWGKRSFAERCALNTPIQGKAAEILKLSMKELIPLLRDKPYIRPILQIHDELLFEVDNGFEQETIELIRSAMERQPFEAFDVPIVAEGEHGVCFGRLSELGVQSNAV